MVLQDEEMRVLVKKLGMNLEAGQWKGLKDEWMMTVFLHIQYLNSKQNFFIYICLPQHSFLTIYCSSCPSIIGFNRV